jgi:hypothetical protein
MSDFDALRARVELAAETLASAEAERHRQNGGLVELLEQLEARFDAQRRELEYCKARVEPLEAVNEQLSGLMGRLLDMIDGGFGEASVEPLREAAVHAARILEQDMGTGAVAAVADDVTMDEASTPPAAADPGDDAGFENVGMAELAAEAEIEEEQDPVLPDLVKEAHRSAIGAADTGDDADVIAEVMEAITASVGELGDVGPADIESMEELAERLAAETAGADGTERGTRNIRDLLARVEAAVEEVRARVEPPSAAEGPGSEEARSAVA